MTPACSNQPTTSPNDTVPNAAAIAESNAPPRPRPHSFHEPLDLAESQLDGGLKSGPYPSNSTDSHPRASIASRTSGLRCTPSRSSTTICPGLGLGARGCSRYAKNATPATAPVDVIASLTPSSRPMAATRLVFSPRLFGTLPTARCPRGRRRRAGSWRG